MNRRSALQKLIAGGAGSLLARSFAEDTPPEFTLRSDVRLVLLDVSVKDRDGKPVLGLSETNFSIFEDGQPRHITVFDQGDVPVTVGILVDESRSMTAKRPQVLTAAQTFIEESNRRDEMFVLHFNDRVLPGLPRSIAFSDDIQELRAALDRGVPDGKTALNDAVLDGLKHLELGTRDKRTLIVISDGGDNASQHSRGQMLNMVENSIATIYTIGLFEIDDPERDPSILRQLARISGGYAYFPNSPAEMVPECRGIAKEIRTRYTIGYPAQAGGRALRHIRIVASARDHGNLVVRARGSYRYDEAENQSKK